MPIIQKQFTDNNVYGTSNNVNMITEDPRPGHNIIYMGSDYQAYDSITLKPIFGANGNFSSVGPPSYGGGATWLADSTASIQYLSTAYMKLGGKHPTGRGKINYIETYANGSSDHNVHVPFSSAWQMDSNFPNVSAVYKDNGDNTKRVFFTSSQHDNSWQRYYSYWWFNVADDQELYDVMPTEITDEATGSAGGMIGFSNLDGTNPGLITLYNLTANYYTYQHRLYSIRYDSSNVNETNLQGGAAHYAQSVGISPSDGLPIVCEQYYGPYDPHFKISKWTGSSWTDLLTNYQTGLGNSPFAAVSASYTTTGTNDNGGGTNDAFLRLGSQWTKMNGSNSKYKFMFMPTVDSNEYIRMMCFRWDTTNDTFVGAGMQGAQTAYADMYCRAQNSNTTYNSFIGTRFNAPYTDNGALPSPLATGQRLVMGIWADVHGYSNRYGDSESYWDADDQSWQSEPVATELQPLTVFPAAGIGNWDTGPRDRRIFCGFTDSANGDTCYYYNLTGVTTVPEMPQDWVWLNTGKTAIAAICKNNTYIYQCRKGDSLLDEGDASTTIYYEAVESFNADIHDASSVAMGWVHTGTIPFQVLQMGIDKHDRVWYVTWEAYDQLHGVSQTVHQQHSKQLWLMTDQTPFRVNLTGNATTDTITYSGSNIDKTLTIECLNFKGQKLAKSITLNITGSDAQFDNASQTKNVTTSATGTVDETITITGSGTFNITATFGA